jgi:transcriptional regulator with XRE-family HTH domain
MYDSSRDQRRDGALLSSALKSVRQRRRMTTRAVAEAMNMPRRTYERFEAGDTRINLDHIHRFAKATDSDSVTILLAVLIGSPELAGRCADNKLGTILAIAVQRFDRRLGDRLAQIDPRVLIKAAVAMFEDLAGADPEADEAQKWLQAGLEELATARPRPGR